MRTAVQQTSIGAFQTHANSGHASAQRARIMRVFTFFEGSDWSIGELAHHLRMEKSTVSARLNELLHSGELEGKPKRKDRISGITIRPVGLPQRQGELFQ